MYSQPGWSKAARNVRYSNFADLAGPRLQVREGPITELDMTLHFQEARRADVIFRDNHANRDVRLFSRILTIPLPIYCIHLRSRAIGAIGVRCQD